MFLESVLKKEPKFLYATSQGPKFYNQVLGMQWIYNEDLNMEGKNLNKN